MRAETLTVTTSADEQTWRYLWSHATYQIMSAIPASAAYEIVAIGNGWGLRSTSNPRRALVIHRPATGCEIGELALTVSGSSTQIIPRCGRGYVEYLDAVADIVETTARAFLQDEPAPSPVVELARSDAP